MKTLILAEPGCTHEGDKATLIRLLETAHACGASCWKPQWVSDAVQMCERRHITVDHPKRAYYLRAYGWLNWNVEWHEEFRDRCHALGMQYAVTCFLPQDVATVAPWVDYHKVASFESGSIPMIWAHRKHWSRTIFSTGMMQAWSGRLTMLRVLRWLCGCRLLQCTSAYPVSLNQVHLRVMRACGFDGLSDHSRDMRTGGWAVCAGAQIIEAHYALYDCDQENPDYPAAHSPGEFEVYVRNIRHAEEAMGDPKKRLQGQETWAVPYRVTI